MRQVADEEFYELVLSHPGYPEKNGTNRKVIPMNPIDIECKGCNAEAGEPCRENCTGKAEWEENNE